MNFNPDNPKWTAYALGELDPRERAELEKELARNADARAYVESIQATAAQVRVALAEEPALELRPEQRRALTEKAAQPVIQFPLRRLVAFGLAASAVLALGIGFYLREQASVQLASVPESSPVVSQSEEVDEFHDAIREGETPVDVGGDSKTVVSGEAIVERNDVVVAAAPTAPPPASQPARPRQEVLSFADGRLGGVNGQVMSRNMVGYVKLKAQLPAEEIPGSGFLSPSLDDFDALTENPFQRVKDHPLSTFSIDVDSASYAVVRKFLSEGQLPPKDAVRIEELVNYFKYDYPQPADGRPFAVHLAAAPAPWNPKHQLVRVALKAKEIDRAERPPVNLVFLIDVSGSMSPANKLPLVKRSMQALAKQLDERDRLAIVVYAGAAGLVLPTTSGEQTQKILESLEQLESGGSTAGGAGIQLAYETARAQFVTGGVNRVILCTDGDFNVGLTQRGDLESLIEEQAKSGVYLTVLGFGMGNYKDSTLELLSNKGNGNYGYIDDFSEARRLLVDQMLGTLVTVAKDVKIQVEFNPAHVAGYRLIGYENRMLKKEDFNNDKVDAGDVGAGHSVTAFYELVPVGEEVPGPGEVDALKYQPGKTEGRATSGELLTAKLRYKLPDGDTSTKLEFPLSADAVASLENTKDFRFATAVAGFGMILRDSPNRGDFSFADVLKLAEGDLGADPGGYRRDFVNMVRNAAALAGKN